MNTEAIALHFGAKRMREGRYLALCPSHGDRSPSLAITQGRDGRTLLKCWAGCPLTNVLKDAGLRPADLFLECKPISSEEVRRLTRARESQAARSDALKVVSREVFDRERLGYDRVRALGVVLAQLQDGDPEVDALTAQFHQACADFAAAEQESERMVSLARTISRQSAFPRAQEVMSVAA